MANVRNNRNVIRANVVSRNTPVQANSVISNEPITSRLTNIPYSTTEKAGIIRIATDNEASEGLSDNTVITPHTLKNAINDIISSETYVFEQSIATEIWTIQHNLNKFPSCIVVDTAGTVQIPDDIIYNSSNQITIQFMSAFAGYAYLN